MFCAGFFNFLGFLKYLGELGAEQRGLGVLLELPKTPLWFCCTAPAELCGREAVGGLRQQACGHTWAWLWKGLFQQQSKQLPLAQG